MAYRRLWSSWWSNGYAFCSRTSCTDSFLRGSLTAQCKPGGTLSGTGRSIAAPRIAYKRYRFTPTQICLLFSLSWDAFSELERSYVENSILADSWKLLYKVFFGLFGISHFAYVPVYREVQNSVQEEHLNESTLVAIGQVLQPGVLVFFIDAPHFGCITREILCTFLILL